MDEKVSSFPAANRVSEYPQVNKAIAMLEQYMARGELEAGEASDLAERVWDCHEPSRAVSIVSNYITLKRLASNGKIGETLAAKLHEKNLYTPVEVAMELHVFERLLEESVPPELEEKLRELYPSATRRLLKAMNYVHATIRELAEADILPEDHRERLEAKDPLIAELELRLAVPRDVDLSDTEQAQAIRQKLASWLEPSGWPESEIL